MKIVDKRSVEMPGFFTTNRLGSDVPGKRRVGSGRECGRRPTGGMEQEMVGRRGLAAAGPTLPIRMGSHELAD